MTEERAVEFVRTMAAASNRTASDAVIDGASLESGVEVEAGFTNEVPGPASERGDASGGLGDTPALALALGAVLLVLLASSLSARRAPQA